MKNRARYYIVSRFNVHSQFSPGTSRNKEWLDHRISLFRAFCVNSVTGQTDRNFQWILLFDEHTSEASLSEVRLMLKATHLDIHILLCGEDFKATLRSYIMKSSEGFSHVITTRLDNDDAIHKDFVRSVWMAFRGQDREYVTFRHGFTYSTGRVALRRRAFLFNPFLTLIERRQPTLTTVYCGNHTIIAKEDQLYTIPHDGGWLQVIHGQNVSNRMIGVPTSISRTLNQDFGMSWPKWPPKAIAWNAYATAYRVALCLVNATRALRAKSLNPKAHQ